MKNHRNKILAIVLSALSVVGMFSFSSGQKIHEFPLCNISNEKFNDGEELVYTIYYNWKFIWIPAGEVKFKAVENEDNYEFIATGKTFSSYESIFKVDDYYYAKVDKETMQSQEFVRRIHEGKYIRYDSISFKQEDYSVDLYHGRTAEDAAFSTQALDECMQDMLSIMYCIRNYDFEQMDKNDVVPFKIFFDKEAFPVAVSYKEKKKKKKIKNLGKFKTFLIEPEVVEGYVFDDDTKMKIYVSDDKNQVPLQVESPISVGSIKAVLKSHKGLKHPLKAQ